MANVVCSCGIGILLQIKRHGLACFLGEHQALLEKQAEDPPLIRNGLSSLPDETRLFERRRSSFSTICQLLQDDLSFWIPITRIGGYDSYTVGDILHSSSSRGGPGGITGVEPWRRCSRAPLP